MSINAPRNFFGQFKGGATQRRPGRKVEPRTDLTRCYFSKDGRRWSLQGMRCKIVAERKAGHLVVEFENGESAVVHKHSLKKLPTS